MKDEGIDDHRHRHAPSLSFFIVRLAEDARDSCPKFISVRMPACKLLCREPHTILKFKGERCDPGWGNGGPMDEHSQVSHAAGNPPLGRQAFGRTVDAAGVERVL